MSNHGQDLLHLLPISKKGWEKWEILPQKQQSLHMSRSIGYFVKSRARFLTFLTFCHQFYFDLLIFIETSGVDTLLLLLLLLLFFRDKVGI